MDTHCEYCGEPALDSDVKCWQCGRPLPGREEVTGITVPVKEAWQYKVSPSTVLIYGMMTILVILSAVVVMYILGQQPKIQVSLGTRTAPNWVQVIDAERTFIVSLPDDWQRIDLDTNGQEDIDNRLAASPLFLLGTYPLGAEADDLSIHFLAEAETPADGPPPPFMLVARSVLLNRLSYEEMVDFLLRSDYAISQAVFIDDFDKSHVSIITRMVIEDGPVDALRCQQQFILGEVDSMLLALCAPAGRYAIYAKTFEVIASSFQRLDS